MASIEKDVVRLDRPGGYRRHPMPHSEANVLPHPTDSPLSFSEALARRRSADVFHAIRDEELSNFLHGVASVLGFNRSDGNLQRRFVASMGALHPAHLVLYRPGRGWFAYLADRHALGAIPVNSKSADVLLTIVREHHFSQAATIICLLSDCDLAANYYQNYLPLLLRDAGVLLGHASLVAAAYNLSFRILGRTGVRSSQTLVPNLPFKVIASGLALIGGPAPLVEDSLSSE